jgi:hypothetical protein
MIDSAVQNPGGFDCCMCSCLIIVSSALGAALPLCLIFAMQPHFVNHLGLQPLLQHTPQAVWHPLSSIAKPDTVV